MYAALPAVLCVFCVTICVLVYLQSKLLIVSQELSLSTIITDTQHSYGYTIWVALAATLCSVVFGFFIAVVVWLYQESGNTGAEYAMQLTLAIPYTVVAFFCLLIFSQYGIFARIIHALFGKEVHAALPNLVHNSFGISIIASYIWKQAPFSCLLFLTRFHRTGKKYFEAARVLGASPWKSIRHVLVPLVLPTAIPLALILFSYNYFSYEVAYIVGTSNPVVNAVYVMQLFTDADVAIHQSSYAVMFISFCVALLVIGGAASIYYVWRGCKYVFQR